MLISIVTAVWNRAETVGDTVASVSGQSYRPLEHVVQDGASDDGTLEILRRAEAAGHVTLLSEPDHGLFDAINRGIGRATGEVIGLVHSDDMLAAPDILDAVAEAFADPAVDAVYGDLDYVSARDPGRVVRRWRSGPFRPALLARGWMPAHPTLFLRRRVFERHGLYDTSYRIAADYDAVLRYFSQPGFRAVHVPRVFVKMRLGGASNASVGHIVQKSREDFRALRSNGVGGMGVLVAKNASKLTQFIKKDPKTGDRKTAAMENT